MRKMIKNGIKNRVILLYFFFKIYLFIYSERVRERQRHRQREKQAPCREPDVGLDPVTPGSHPGLQAALNRCATGAPWASVLETVPIFCLSVCISEKEFGKVLPSSASPESVHLDEIPALPPAGFWDLGQVVLHESWFSQL